MGPYCKFCDSRCFYHPIHVSERLSTDNLVKILAQVCEVPMLASCPAGRAWDKQELGVSADDFLPVESTARGASET